MKPKQCLVIGLGRFGSAVATTLYTLGHEVIAVDHDENNVQRVMNKVSSAMILDATDENALGALGLQDFDVVVVAIGSDVQASILATLNAKSLGAPYVVSKAVDDMSRRVLEKVGADQIVRPEHDTGLRVARSLANPNLRQGLDLGSDYAVMQVEINRAGGTLAQLNLGGRYGIDVVALSRQGVVNINPPPTETLRPHDTLVVIGRNHALDRLRHALDSEQQA